MTRQPRAASGTALRAAPHPMSSTARPCRVCESAKSSSRELGVDWAKPATVSGRLHADTLIIAHGIWNLARSGAEFRKSVREAARAALPDARLFVFTFSRHTIPDGLAPVPGETFVFTEFSGQPQCFLTAEQLVEELGRAGFMPMPEWPLRELNRRAPGALLAGGPPVIFEGGFRRGQ